MIVQMCKSVIDYSHKESVQFEDDDYYYYVKAIPKVENAQKKRVKTMTEEEVAEQVKKPRPQQGTNGQARQPRPQQGTNGQARQPRPQQVQTVRQDSHAHSKTETTDRQIDKTSDG